MSTRFLVTQQQYPILSRTPAKSQASSDPTPLHPHTPISLRKTNTTAQPTTKYPHLSVVWFLKNARCNFRPRNQQRRGIIGTRNTLVNIFREALIRALDDLEWLVIGTAQNAGCPSLVVKPNVLTIAVEFEQRK
jgi:hypothetical protein